MTYVVISGILVLLGLAKLLYDLIGKVLQRGDDAGADDV
jgi:hypothetical protein